MIHKHPIWVGSAIGTLVWLLAVAVLLKGDSGSALYEVSLLLSWAPDRATDWITGRVAGGPVEAGAFIFLGVSLLYWIGIGVGTGALFMMRSSRPSS
jgi:hypothetical protein